MTVYIVVKNYSQSVFKNYHEAVIFYEEENFGLIFTIQQAREFYKNEIRKASEDITFLEDRQHLLSEVWVEYRDRCKKVFGYSRLLEELNNETN